MVTIEQSEAKLDEADEVSPERSLRLTDDEIVVLDGRCRPERQADVEDAKARLESARLHSDLTPALAGLIADVVAEAKKEGRLAFYGKGISWCSICQKSGGYAKHKRGGRYHRKGDDNHKKPLTISGVEFAHRFVTMQGHVTLGACSECVAQILVPLVRALADVEAQLPKALTGVEPKHIRFSNVRCKLCGWRGHEGAMTWKATLMMDGLYPAKCPKCVGENGFGRSNVEQADGFTVVPAESVNERIRKQVTR